LLLLILLGTAAVRAHTPASDNDQKLTPILFASPINNDCLG